MDFEDFFVDARSSIAIVGTSSLIPHLERSARFFADLLTLNEDLRLTILCESDSELFSQSLCVDTDYSPNRASFPSLRVHRNRTSGSTMEAGLRAEIGSHIEDADRRQQILGRVEVWQVNIRSPLNLVMCDDKLWCCAVTHALPTLRSYFPVSQGGPLYEELRSFLEFCTDTCKGGVYLSRPGEELIQLYDKSGYPRGIFPRACFYTTEFQRYSIWGFVFNRKGQLLLHQRSEHTDDNRLLWDKSIGGHVNLGDSSTYITAQRELVEELFLPQAEYSKYIKADLGDIINFGVWNPKKRPEIGFKGAFAGLGPADWVFFRAADDKGDPLIVTRISERRIHDGEGRVSYKPTVFISDIYLFIAPPDYLDTPEQMKQLLAVAEKTGAAYDHQLVSVAELRAWIQEEEHKGTSRETFTDDLHYIIHTHRGLLEGFSEFIDFVI